MMSGSVEPPLAQEILMRSHGKDPGEMVPSNGGPIFLDDDSIQRESQVIGKQSLKSNCEGPIANGSNVTRNGAVTTNVQIDGNEEPKNVHNARSTDLLFLKSVVASNTLERQKKVGFLTFLITIKRDLNVNINICRY